MSFLWLRGENLFKAENLVRNRIRFFSKRVAKIDK